MLLGFFTYKAGVVGRGAYELLSDSARGSSMTQDAATDVKGIVFYCLFKHSTGQGVDASVSGSVQLW